MSDEAPSVRIVTEGDGTTSHVFTADGVELRYVEQVDLTLRVGKPNVATLHVLNVAGQFDAEVASIKERLLPEPQSVLVVKVGAYEYPDDLEGGRKSPISITRLTNRGVDHTETTTMCEGWVSACEPFELTVPEEEE